LTLPVVSGPPCVRLWTWGDGVNLIDVVVILLVFGLGYWLGMTGDKGNRHG
jgi:hypothetical protein